MAEWPEKARPGFVVFHHDSRPDGYGEGLPQDQSYFPKPRIEEFMRGVLVHPGNFLGLIDAQDETLQFFVEADRSILVDFIVRGKNGSMVKTGTLDEAIALARDAGPSLAAVEIPGAEFRAW